MTTITTTRPLFDTQLNNVTEFIPYNSKWGNAVSSFDAAIKGEFAPSLQPGEQAKSVMPSGADILFIGTRFGNCVIYKRYADSEVIVSSLPNAITQLYLDTFVGTRLDTRPVTLNLLLGNSNNAVSQPNIGLRIEELFLASDLASLRMRSKK